MRKPTFCICENKDADQLRGNLPKYDFQASSHLLYLYSLVCVGLGRKPERWFSHAAVHMSIHQNLLKYCISLSANECHIPLITVTYSLVRRDLQSREI